MQPLREQAINKVNIWKEFGGTWFPGTVTAFYAKKQYYRVTYADGDDEDLEWGELVPLLPEPPAGAPRYEASQNPTRGHKAQQKQPQNNKRHTQQQQQQQQLAAQAVEFKVGKPPTDNSSKLRSSSSKRSPTPDVTAAGQDQCKRHKQAAAVSVTQAGQVLASPELEPAPSAAAAAAAMTSQPEVDNDARTGRRLGRRSRSGYSAPEAAAAAADLLTSSAAPSAAAATVIAAAAAAPHAPTRRMRGMARKSCADAAPKPAAPAAPAGETGTKQRQQQQGDVAGVDAPPPRKKQRTTGSGSKPSRAQQQQQQQQDLAAGAAAAAAAEQPKKKRQYKRKTPAAAGSTGGGAAAGASEAAATAAAAAAAVSTAEAILAKVECQLTEQVTFQPALALQKEHLKAACKSIECAAGNDTAAAVVMAPPGTKAPKQQQQQQQQQPLWAVADADVKVFKGDVTEYLRQHAVDFEPGREPYRAFLGLPQLVSRKRNADGTCTVSVAAAIGAAAAAAAAATSAGKSITAAEQQRAAVAAAAESVRAFAALLEGRVFYVAEQPFEDPASVLATAIKVTKDEFWREFRLATVTEAERVAARKAAQARAAAAGGAADEEGSQGPPDGSDNSQAAEGGEDAGPDGGAGVDHNAADAGDVDVTKNPSARPDRVAESRVLKSGRAVNRIGSKQRDTWGHLPGVSINDKFMLRSEAHVLGVHKSPMTGIVSEDIPVPIVLGNDVHRTVKAATSIVMSGCYQDDRDTPTDIITYTGEGGNDLLGNKKQMSDQKLQRGNRALLANIALGLPVRVLRRNDDKDSATNSVLWYDGLYSVVSWVKTIGEEGKVVIMYGLKRLPGQEPSKSKPIERFKSVKAANKKTDLLVREHIICRDLSKGKEATPIVVVNEVDRELPPGLDPELDAEWIVDDQKGSNPLQPSKEKFRYITADEYDRGVQPPQPPTVAEEGSREAAEAMAAELNAAAAGRHDLVQKQQHQGGGGSSRCRSTTSSGSAAAITAGVVAAGAVQINPSGTGGRPNGCLCWYSKQLVVKRCGEAPHDLLKRMNWGNLPYESRIRSTGRECGPRLPVSRGTCPVLTECGDWTGCTDPHCDQRQGARGVQYRLELFKTRDRGWGVRSWDTIKCGTLVCIMWGRVARNGSTEWESSYFFDKTPRTWGSIIDASGPLTEEHKALLKDEKEWDTKYVLCAKEQGGIARFINHSCDPNLYVQPMCIGHTDMDMVAVGLFACGNIPPFTELTYDYGHSYVEQNLVGVCLCGAACCKFKPEQQQLQQTATTDES